MSVVSVKIDICNLALSKLGNYGSVEDIDTPQKPTEKIFRKWYDVAREKALKELMPNFALSRRLIAQDTTATPPFGYDYAYKKPEDCLKVLGIGEIETKKNLYSVEGRSIVTNEDYTDDGLPIRFIKDITDTTKFSAEFVSALALYLAKQTCMEITQDEVKYKQLYAELLTEKANVAALSGQENRPIRINRSKFAQSRSTAHPTNYDKE
ncbi:MAG: hypothetical protein U9O65_02785 [Thermotogota bacterium]|nr:hypothetical protein [Thermotogota bacterium]